METEKHAVENILVEYHDLIARHRLDIRMNTEFKVRLIPKDDKAVCSQSIPMPIHLKEDLIVELALCTNMGLSQSDLSRNMQVPFLHSENPTENYISLWISGKSTPTLQMIILTIVTQLAFCQTQHNTWQGNLYSANLTALGLIIVCRERNNGQWKSLLSILLAEFSPRGQTTRS